MFIALVLKSNTQPSKQKKGDKFGMIIIMVLSTICDKEGFVSEFY